MLVTHTCANDGQQKPHSCYTSHETEPILSLGLGEYTSTQEDIECSAKLFLCSHPFLLLSSPPLFLFLQVSV